MAGSGERFGDPIPKQFHLLHGKRIYLWTLHQFLESGLFEEMILVCSSDWKEEITKEVGSKAQVVLGGKTRQGSSYQGLLAAGKSTEIIVIHDAVRPFVSKRILMENIETARKYGAVDTCIPSYDTLVHAPQKDKIQSIPSRSEYFRGQTPQSFSYPLILKAHEVSNRTGATDDCQLLLDLSREIRIVEGEERNIKITTPLDLSIAEILS